MMKEHITLLLLTFLTTLSTLVLCDPSSLNGRGYVIDSTRFGDLLQLNDPSPRSGQGYMFYEKINGLTLTPEGKLQRLSGHQWSSLDDLQLEIIVNNALTNSVRITITLHLAPPTTTPANIFTGRLPMWAKVQQWIRPGDRVATLRAVIADQYSDIYTVYRLEAGGDDHFQVDQISGEVTIADRYQHPIGTVYKLAVSARCEGVIYPMGASPTEVLSVKVDTLGPRFDTGGGDYFTISVPEDSIVEQQIYDCSAFSFYYLPVKYKLLVDDNQNLPSSPLPVRIDGNTGKLILTRSQTYDQRPNSFRFSIEATEDKSGAVTTIKAILFFAPVNKNAPKFPIDVYVTSSPVKENVIIGTEIMRFTVYDSDGGDFSKMTFTCSEDVFEVITDSEDKRTGILKVKSALDYDYLPRHTYSFTVTATDGGGLSATTKVLVEIENINDELPVMYPAVQNVRLKTLSHQGMFVAMIQAYDPDGDTFSYSLDPSTYSSYFTVDRISGQLTLTEDLPVALPDFSLSFKLTDDDNCCSTSSLGRKYNNGTLNVHFIGINHPPSFKVCPGLGVVEINENTPNNTEVYKLVGVDIDSGVNGETFMSPSYKIIQDSNYFRIQNNGKDGQIYVHLNPGESIDREELSENAIRHDGQVYETLLVKIVDGGGLEGYCFMYIKIVDINDESPEFFRDSAGYSIYAKRTPGDQSPIQIMAYDRDYGVNAEITYSILKEQTGCSNCVSIDPNTGWLTLHDSINKFQSTEHIQEDSTSSILFVEIEARDKGPNGGLSSKDIIKIVIVDPSLPNLLPPIWIDANGNPLGKNNVPVVTMTETVSNRYAINLTAIPPADGMNIKCSYVDQIPRNRPGNFKANSPSSCHMSLDVHSLDFETQQSYYISLRAVSSLNIYINIFVLVKLVDINDEEPDFQGLSVNGYYVTSVSENVKKGDTILEIKALDFDINPLFNTIRYGFQDKCDVCANFTLKGSTIEAGTPNGPTRDIYKYIGDSQIFLKIMATDGKYISTIEVLVKYEGFSTTEPVFKTHNNPFEIEEKQVFNTVVSTLTASVDKRQDDLQYYIINGNDQHAFGVQRLTGKIFTMRYMTYENVKVYNLKYRAFHGTDKFQDVDVAITILKSNNMDPVLPGQSFYQYNDYSEGDDIVNDLQIMTIDTSSQYPNHNPGISGVHVQQNLFTLRNQNSVFLTSSLDRDLPNGHASWLINFYLGTSVESAAYGVIEVIPKDINDNGPFFDETCCVFGDFPENLPIGSGIFDLKIVDYDTPINSITEYELISCSKNANNENLFSVDKIGGNWRIQTLQDFDYETDVKSYFVNIRARNQPVSDPFVTTEQTIYLTLRDANDNPPSFAQTTYSTSIDEFYKNDDIVIRITANDDDVDDIIDYVIVSGNTNNHFYVDSIHSTRTGVIKINKMIDISGYPSKMFNLVLKATTRDPNRDDSVSCNVNIEVKDANDHAPQLVIKSQFISVVEGTDHFEDVFDQTQTKDADYGINGQFTYSIDYASSSNVYPSSFTVDPLIGKLFISKDYDIDQLSQKWVMLYIVATDKGTPPQSSSVAFRISFNDTNDEPPQLITKSVDISKTQTSTTIKIYDADSLPASYSITCTQGDCGYFSFVNMNKDGGTLRSVKSLDEGAVYSLTVVVSDGLNSSPPQRLRVRVISFTNANQHQATTTSLQVVNYDGGLKTRVIGYVGFQDLDYKMDTGKRYTTTTPVSYFKVNQNNGAITIDEATPYASYQLNVQISDGNWETVTSIVRITVTYITNEMLNNSASIRLKGTTSADLLTPIDGTSSALQKLLNSLAAGLDTAPANVVLLSLVDIASPPGGGGGGGANGHVYAVDVTYAAHGSPYYTAEKLEVNAKDNIDQIMSATNLEIDSIPANPCHNSNCLEGCTNVLKVGGPLTSQGGGAAFTGIKATYSAVCGCSVLAPPLCPCLNGGTCLVQDGGRTSCQCPRHYNGDRCQRLLISLNGLDSFAVLTSAQSCRTGVTSLQVKTTSPNSVVFYVGTDKANQQLDYSLLKLENGIPIYELNLDRSSSAASITLKSTSIPRIDDGQWHTIEIWKNGQEVRMVVDHCKSAVTTETISSTSSDRSTCEVTATIASNTYSFADFSGYSLKLGAGKSSNTIPSFKGCIKNLRHNGLLYDLEIGPRRVSKGASNICQSDTCQSCPSMNQRCLGDACACLPGYMGSDCSIEAPVIDIETDDSFLLLGVSPSLPGNNTNTHTVDLMFRTRQNNGVIYTMQSFSTLEQFVIEMKDGKLKLKVDLGGGYNELTLDRIQVSDGQWHTVKASNHNNQITLILDNGQGERFATMQNSANEFSVLYVGTGSDVFTGSAVIQNKYAPPTSTNAIKNSCIKDVRLNGHLLATPTFNPSDSASSVKLTRNIGTNCTSDGCRDKVCPSDQWCLDLWRLGQCRCKTGYTVIGGVCVLINDCSISRCFNGGYCMMYKNAWRCNCPAPWTGRACLQKPIDPKKRKASMATGTIIIIVFAILVLLVIVLLLALVYRRRSPKKLPIYEDHGDIREAIGYYDEEGAGEEDITGYDLSRLQKPIIDDYAPVTTNEMVNEAFQGDSMPDINKPRVADILKERLKQGGEGEDDDADKDDQDLDSLRNYELEGNNSSVGSLSSLDTSGGSDVDFEFLNDYGPKFKRLADLYGVNE